MISKKQSILLVALGALVVGLLVVGLWYEGFIGSGNRALLRLVKDQPELLDLYNRATTKEKEIKAQPDKAVLYFDEGLAWKSIAERIPQNQEPFFRRSLVVYERGIDKFGDKNILFYLNAGGLAERVNETAKAETYYKKAIAISPGDEQGYLRLVDLYVYRLGKSQEEILAVFADGGKRMFNPIALVAARAAYLRRVGDYTAALEDYKTLSENFPSNEGYKQVIQELEQLVKPAN